MSNSDTDEHNQVTATLKYLNDHIYMWVDDTAKLNDADLRNRRIALRTRHTRPIGNSSAASGRRASTTTRGCTSSTARGMGARVAGYYSSADEYSRLVNPYSNEKEMFYISADSSNAKPNSTFYDGTLAHEFQHMIHWANDRNEDSWVNEGMSELASYLNGFDPGGADAAYMQKPDTQLTTWSDPSLGNSEHYGASYLFMQYFLDRFGEDADQGGRRLAANSVDGFNSALAKAGRPERFDDIYADWVIANYLNKRDADASGRYGYKDIEPDKPKSRRHIAASR